jgi:hypothetical protein
MILYVSILALAYIQNISFSMVSRARNRNNMWYHCACAVASNGIWFASMGLLVANELTWDIAPFYIVGTIAGSLTGSKVSIWIEEKFGITV